MKNKLFLLLSLLVLASMVLTACGPKATEVPEVVVTEPPATDVPFVGYTLAAPNCDYGGFIKSVEATDKYTVTFNLCKSDPAFLSKIAFSPFAIYPEE